MTTFKEQVDPLYKSIVDGGAKNYNNILKLTNLYKAYNNDLSAINDGNEETMKNLRYLTHILYKIYYKLAVKLQLNPSMATNDKEAILYKWLRKNYDVNFKNKVLLYYINQLEQENSLSLDCIDIFMKCLELEATFFASKMGASYFPNKTLQKLVLTLFKDSTTDKTYLVKHFSDKYYKKHADIQFYFQVELQSLFEESQENISLDSKTNAGYWLELVNHDSNYDDKEADLDVFVPHPPTLMENENKFKTAFEDNWLNILSNGLITNEQFKSILTILHKRVIPRLKQPTKLMDFLTDCYDNESSDLSVKLLALNGLFNLMHMFNLEYPNFYSKLYALFTEELLHLKYRSRFIRLIELFLKSSHLSINLVASFIKRMARLLLTASPGAIVSVLPLIYNLLKLHPNCMILIHDPEFVPKNYELYEKVKNLKFIDPYDITEVDPELTDAINSSLWEVDTLMDHYHPNVASLAKIFKQPFRKLNYNIEDFLDWNYKILLDNELKRKIKILPSLDLDVNTKGSKLFKDDSSYLKTIKW